MSVLSLLSSRQDADSALHASYFLLLLLAVFIAACDFLIFLPFQFGVPQLLHVVSILLPLIFWGLRLKVDRPLVQKIIPVVVFLLMFSIWSYQLYLNRIFSEP